MNSRDARDRPARLEPVLAAGVVAGTLDFLYAWLFWKLKAGVSMQRILQSVAAGLLGPASLTGGRASAALGLALQYFIAITMALTYYVAARRWPLLARRPFACGAAYGFALYAVMNWLVVPLSAASRGSTDPLWISLSIVVHAAFVGVPIALGTRQAHVRLLADLEHRPQ